MKPEIADTPGRHHGANRGGARGIEYGLAERPETQSGAQGHYPTPASTRYRPA